MAPAPIPAAQALTVTELTLAIQGTLQGAFGEVWVRGELSGVRRVSSGHVYLSLQDQGATLPAVIWRSTAARLRFDLVDGTDVVCRGGVDVYPPHGRYQLIVHEIHPLGVGALQLAFERMRKKLEAEGLFAPERKRPIPFLPRRIALVTSKSGAAVRDLVTVIHRRFPRVEIVLVAARVQGDGAAEDVARGLRLADERAGADVIVVGRGGGSPEDLWAFNEEPVARAIAACATPVVSAVGHEIDVTIADLVADLRAATPSQAGELVVPVRAELIDDLVRRESRLVHLVRTRVDRAWQRVEASAGRPCLRDPRTRTDPLRRHLDHVGARLASRHPAAELARHRSTVEDLGARARLAVERRLERAREGVASLRGRLSPAVPRGVLDRGRARLLDAASRAAVGARRRLDRALSVHEARRAALEALSPLRVLDRGYSLTRVGPRILKSVAQARPGHSISTQLADGVVESRVEAVRPATKPAATLSAPRSP